MFEIVTVTIVIIFIGMVVLISWRQPAAMLSLLVMMYSLEQWAQARGGYFSDNRQALNILVAVAIPIGVVSAFRKYSPQVVLKQPAIFYLLVVLFFYAGVSWIWTPVPDVHATNWMKSGPFLLLSLIVGPMVITTYSNLSDAMRWIMIIGVPLTLLLLFTVEWTYRGLAVEGFGRGAKGNPLAIGDFGAALAITAALYYARSTRLLIAILRWGVFLLGLMLAIKSGSRGQTLSVLLVVLLFLPISRQFSSIKGFTATILTLIVIVTITVIIWSAMATSDRWQFNEMTQDYSSGRLTPVLTLLNHWLQEGPIVWLFGLGQAASYDPELLGIYPHFVPAEVLTELGLIGFSLYIYILWLTLKTAINLLKKEQYNPSHRAAIVCFIALAFYAFLISLKQGSLIGSPFLFLFTMCLTRAGLNRNVV